MTCGLLYLQDEQEYIGQSAALQKRLKIFVSFCNIIFISSDSANIKLDILDKYRTKIYNIDDILRHTAELPKKFDCYMSISLKTTHFR